MSILLYKNLLNKHRKGYKEPNAKYAAQPEEAATAHSINSVGSIGAMKEEERIGTRGKGKNVIEPSWMPKPNADIMNVTVSSGSANTETIETPQDDLDEPNMKNEDVYNGNTPEYIYTMPTKKGVKAHYNKRMVKEAYTEQGGGAPDSGNSLYAPTLNSTTNSKFPAKLRKGMTAKANDQKSKGSSEDSFPRVEGVICDLNDVKKLIDEVVFIDQVKYGKLLKEELKVGEYDEDDDAKKKAGIDNPNKGVKKIRKYLGNRRGTTATGKPAHAVEISPLITNDTSVNKTTPGPKKPG